MTTDDTLRQRIEAELDRREAIANAATEGPWAIWHDLDDQGFYTVGDEAGVIPEGQHITEGECNPTAHVYIEPDAEHIALHDPADALRRYAAARRILARHRPILWESLTGERRCARCGDTLDCPEIADLAASLGLSTTSEEQQP